MSRDKPRPRQSVRAVPYRPGKLTIHWNVPRTCFIPGGTDHWPSTPDLMPYPIPGAPYPFNTQPLLPPGEVPPPPVPGRPDAAGWAAGG